MMITDCLNKILFVLNVQLTLKYDYTVYIEEKCTCIYTARDVVESKPSAVQKRQNKDITCVKHDLNNK